MSDDHDDPAIDMTTRRPLPAEDLARIEADNRTLQAEAAAHKAKYDEKARAEKERRRHHNNVLGSLLVGEYELFGKRVELVWPDGLPDHLTEETLKSYGRKLLDEEP